MSTPTPTHPQPKSCRHQSPSGPRPRARGGVPTSKASPALGEFSVSDGRHPVGTLEQSGDRWVAITTTGKRLGPFNTMTEAARAL
jgi:hypothetical protein